MSPNNEESLIFTMKDFYENYSVESSWNISCNRKYVPSAIENVENLGILGQCLLYIGTILTTLTVYFAIDGIHNILSQNFSSSYKSNIIAIFIVYPIASTCNLLAIAVPRSQLLTEMIIQIFLTISLYRLYLLLVEICRPKITKQTLTMLKVGPCCCWPCLPCPKKEMTKADLFMIKIMFLQLPIVQISIYCIFLFMVFEDPILFENYNLYCIPVMIFSICWEVYGLRIILISFEDVAVELKLRQKIFVIQLVLLFAKLQAAIIKGLFFGGLLPCNPPVTPDIYANVLQNGLMIIEMLILCYAAKRVFYVAKEKETESSPSRTIDRTKDKTESTDLTNNNETQSQVTSPTIFCISSPS